VVHQIKTIKLVELNFLFKENALFERKSKATMYAYTLRTMILYRLEVHSWPAPDKHPLCRTIRISFQYGNSGEHHSKSKLCLRTLRLIDQR
jgi:hypothetical protein